MIIDNFALTMHQTCPRKFWYRIERGYTAHQRTGALSFGATIHKGIEDWYRLRSPAAAEAAIHSAWAREAGPKGDWRTLDKALTTMRAYIGRWGHEGRPSEEWDIVGAAQGMPVLETKFTIGLGWFLPCEVCGARDTGDPKNPLCSFCKDAREPIEYGGIFDGIVQHHHNFYILEHKTTSVMGAKFWDQFKPNNQITGYIWAARSLTDKPVSGCLINAIAIYKASPSRFERNFTVREDEEIAEWIANVHAVCQEIVDHRRRAWWPMRTMACTLYSKCEYYDVCSLEPRFREPFLESNYTVAPWNHATRDEVPAPSDE